MPANKQPCDPRPAIAAEAVKASKSPRRVGLLAIKSANDWIEDSINTPDPKTYFHNLIVQYENTVIFASSNVGKSILAIQIAEDIARQERILYVDLELSAKQFQMRYTDPATGYRHIFPANFTRAEIAPELIAGADLEQEILGSIEEAARQGTKFFVIDNITFICNDSEKGSTAGSFMMRLISLKKLYSLTTVVIAHTPKRRGWEPITQNDLAGSAKLINFFDAGIALARSAKDDRLRFEIQGYAHESDHLRSRDAADDYDENIEILKLQRDGKSVREIASALDMASTTVFRRLKKAKENNITIPAENPDPVPSVPPVPLAEQTEHPEQRLPFKEEDGL